MTAPTPEVDPLEALPFRVLIIDERNHISVIEDGLSSTGGLNALLRSMTDLDQRQRSLFMRQLDDIGQAHHYGKNGDKKFYTLLAVERRRYPDEETDMKNLLSTP